MVRRRPETAHHIARPGRRLVHDRYAGDKIRTVVMYATLNLPAELSSPSGSAQPQSRLDRYRLSRPCAVGHFSRHFVRATDQESTPFTLSPQYPLVLTADTRCPLSARCDSHSSSTTPAGKGSSVPGNNVIFGNFTMIASSAD